MRHGRSDPWNEPLGHRSGVMWGCMSRGSDLWVRVGHRAWIPCDARSPGHFGIFWGPESYIQSLVALQSRLLLFNVNRVRQMAHILLISTAMCSSYHWFSQGRTCLKSLIFGFDLGSPIVYIVQP